MLTAAQLIAALDLRPLPLEGGYYRETYRSADQLAPEACGGRFRSGKSAGTAIYYLLTPETSSAIHRLPTDEIYHFYLGSPVQLVLLFPDGSGRLATLGPDLLAGQSPQLVVPRGVWQGSYLADGGAYALLGTTMAPGFDFSDYEGGDRAALTDQYPSLAHLIGRLTPE
jgi:predicted cupin superfamily sugar epimerase